jgi:hypothetical protein
MNHIMRRLLSPFLVMLLAGSLAGCYTLPKPSGVAYDSEEIPVIVIPEPWPIPPPPPPPPPRPPRPPLPPPLSPPSPPPTRPIDPKQPVKPAAEVEVRKKEPPGNRTLEMESTRPPDGGSVRQKPRSMRHIADDPPRETSAFCSKMVERRESNSPPAGSKEAWTGTERIRTCAGLPLEVVLSETVGPPKYQQIAEAALHLNQLELSNEAVARHVGVDGKTVSKALSRIMDGR